MLQVSSRIVAHESAERPVIQTQLSASKGITVPTAVDSEMSLASSSGIGNHLLPFRDETSEVLLYAGTPVGSLHLSR